MILLAVLLWVIGILPTLAFNRLMYDDTPPERLFVLLMLWPVATVAFTLWLLYEIATDR